MSAPVVVHTKFSKEGFCWALSGGRAGSLHKTQHTLFVGLFLLRGPVVDILIQCIGFSSGSLLCESPQCITKSPRTNLLTEETLKPKLTNRSLSFCSTCCLRTWVSGPPQTNGLTTTGVIREGKEGEKRPRLTRLLAPADVEMPAR